MHILIKRFLIMKHPQTHIKLTKSSLQEVTHFICINRFANVALGKSSVGGTPVYFGLLKHNSNANNIPAGFEVLCLPLEPEHKLNSLSLCLHALLSDGNDVEQHLFACKNSSSAEDSKCSFSQQMES